MLDESILSVHANKKKKKIEYWIKCDGCVWTNTQYTNVYSILILTTSCNFFFETVTVAFDETVDVDNLVDLPVILLDTVNDIPASVSFLCGIDPCKI